MFCATFGQNKTEIYPYISPGVRIGYMFGEGFTLNYEVTVGVVGGEQMIWHSSIALGYQVKPKNPTSYIYVAAQGGWAVFGISLGKILDKNDKLNIIGSRFSGYIGGLPLFIEFEPLFPLYEGLFRIGGIPLGFISYEYISFPLSSEHRHSFGLWGKIPFAKGFLDEGAFLGNLGTCFAAGTEITMSDGSLKRIEDIEVGDMVLSYNLEKMDSESDEVLELYSPTNDNLMEMIFSDGTVIHSTFDHPYYIKDKGWCSLKPDVTKELITNITEVGLLEIGDICYVLKDGELTEVEFLGSQRLTTFQRTYTIKKLKKNNAFFAEGVLVGVETVKEITNKSTLCYLR